VHLADFDVACRVATPPPDGSGEASRAGECESFALALCRMHAHVLQQYWVLWMYECMSTQEYVKACALARGVVDGCFAAGATSAAQHRALIRSLAEHRVCTRSRSVSGKWQRERNADDVWNEVFAGSRARRRHTQSPFLPAASCAAAEAARSLAAMSLLEPASPPQARSTSAASFNARLRHVSQLCDTVQNDVVEVVCGHTASAAMKESKVPASKVCGCIAQRAKASYDALQWALSPGVDHTTLRRLCVSRVAHASASGTCSIFAPELRDSMNGWAQRTPQTDVWGIGVSLWYIFCFQMPAFDAVTGKLLPPSTKDVHSRLVMNTPECEPLMCALSKMLERDASRRILLKDIIQDATLRATCERLHMRCAENAKQESRRGRVSLHMRGKAA